METKLDLVSSMLRGRHFECGIGASVAELRSLEVTLSVQLRGSYWKFLRRFGFLSFEDLEVFGVGPATPSHLQLERITRSEREQASPSLPLRLVPVFNDGGGNLACVDLGAGEADPPVVYWDHALGPDQELDVEAENFKAWLLREVEERCQGT